MKGKIFKESSKLIQVLGWFLLYAPKEVLINSKLI